MKKVVGIIIALVIIITGVLFFTMKSHSIEGKVIKHLMEDGVEVNEINEIIVKYSIKSSLLFSSEWTISVEYHDEPDVYYMYFYKDKKIEFTGIAARQFHRILQKCERIR